MGLGGDISFWQQFALHVIYGALLCIWQRAICLLKWMVEIGKREDLERAVNVPSKEGKAMADGGQVKVWTWQVLIRGRTDWQCPLGVGGYDVDRDGGGRRVRYHASPVRHRPVRSRHGIGDTGINDYPNRLGWAWDMHFSSSGSGVWKINVIPLPAAC